MKAQKIILLATSFCLFMACSSNNSSSSDSQDTLAAKTDTLADTTKTAPPVEVKDPAEDLNLVFKDIITTMKSNGDLSTLNKYLSPAGVYLLYPVGDVNSSYEHYDKLDQLNGKDANGSGADTYDNFRKQLSKIDTSLLSLKYDLITADECSLKKKGTQALLIQKSITLLSDCYNGILQVTGDDPDKAELKRLKDTEKTATEKIIINVFDRSTGNGAEVFYFAQVDKKWYLIALDLTDCGGANE